MNLRFNLLFLILGIIGIFNTGCNSKEQGSNAGDIMSAFELWSQKQIEEGEFVAADSCQTEYFAGDDTLSEFYYAALGIPQGEGSIKVFELELNEDTLPDALILFSPVQCDGGNAAQWIQYQLLAISGEEGYFIQDSYFKQFEPDTGFFRFEGAEEFTVYGYYYRFLDDDALCCPSVKRPMRIDLRTNAVQMLK